MTRAACSLAVAALAVASGMLGAGCGQPGGSRPAGSRPAGDAAALESWAAGICSADRGGWCWAHRRPFGVRLNRLWGSGPRDVWAVGELGAIIHFDGERWARVASGTTDSLVAIAGRGPGDAWAIGKNRTLLRLSGGDWRPVEMPKLENEEQLADLLVLSSGEAWIVGGMTHSSLAGEELISRCVIGHHDGATWRFDEEDGCGPLGRVWGAAANDVWADGGDVVHWNGRYLIKNPRQAPAKIVGRHGFASGWRLEITWGGGGAGRLVDPRRSPLALDDARDFWAAGADDVWAITKDSALAHFDGQRWSHGDEPLEIRGVAARAADDVWAVGSGPVLLHWDGRGWRSWRMPVSAGQYPVAIATAAANDVWVLGERAILRFDGSRWSTVAADLKVTPRAMFVRGPNDAWVAAGSKLLHWNGRAVEAIDTDFNASHIWGDARELWAGWPLRRWDGGKMIIPPGAAGPEGKGLHFSSGAVAGGAVWLAGARRISRFEAGRLEVLKELPGQKDLPGHLDTIWASPSGEIWAAGTHIVHGGGSSWTVEDRPGVGEIKAVGGADGLVWVLGPEGLLFRR
jgi:hypothetical protein